jgi:membrane protein implicated in regulation of membrane protease activity
MLSLIAFIGRLVTLVASWAVKAVLFVWKILVLLVIGVFLLIRRSNRRKREQKRVEEAYVRGRVEAEALKPQVDAGTARPAAPPSAASVLETSAPEAPAAGPQPS